MRPGQDGGFDDAPDGRRPTKPGPLEIEPVSPETPMRRLGLPFAIAVAVLIVGVALAGRLGAGTAAGPTEEPNQTPFPWTAATVNPTFGTPWVPGTEPGATPAPGATAVPTATPLPPMDIRMESNGVLYGAGDTVRFTVTLSNPTGYDMELSSCPTYRMVLIGSFRDEPERVLNCGDWNLNLEPWHGVQFNMEFVLPADAQPGPLQVLWHVTSVVEANGRLNIILGFPTAPTPEPTI